MNVSYELYPDANVVIFTSTGELYEKEQNMMRIEHGGDPISKHKTLQEALIYREDLGEKWFGLDEFPFVKSIWDNFERINGWYGGMDRKGRQVYNVWTPVTKYAKRYLKRNLTEQETTEISLSLRFGPTPLLTDRQKIYLFNKPRKLPYLNKFEVHEILLELLSPPTMVYK